MAEASTPGCCCPRLGTEPSVPLPGAGSGPGGREHEEHLTEQVNGEMGASFPGSTMGDTDQRDAWLPFPTHCSQGPQGPVYINWWVGSCWVTDFRRVWGTFSVHAQAELCACVCFCDFRRVPGTGSVLGHLSFSREMDPTQLTLAIASY